MESCGLLPEGHIVGHACREAELVLGSGDDVQVAQHVWPPLGLVGAESASINSETPALAPKVPSF